MPKKKIKFNNKLKEALLCSTIISILFSGGLFASTNVETLSGVQGEINRQEHLLVTRNQKLTQLQSELEGQEKAIGKLINEILELESSLQQLNSSIEDLEFEHQQLENKKKTQIKQLKELLNSQYRQGKHASINALLSGQGANLDRMTVYAERLSIARSEIIGELEVISTELQLKSHSLKEQKQQKTEILTKVNTDKLDLEQKQLAQQEIAKEIQQQIKNNKVYLSELKENERRLSEALALAKKAQAKRALEEARVAKQKAELEAKKKDKATELAKTIRMDGIGNSKGQLKWPVRGKLIHRFGSQQSGQLKWHGIVISAKEGSAVEAIYDGTVVLSNWLRGYGLMLVVDHGKGDMSFYGYNQTLLRKVGDKVKTGETIALVGNSGGQTSSGLYFEIRRKGDAINPAPWLRR